MAQLSISVNDPDIQKILRISRTPNKRNPAIVRAYIQIKQDKSKKWIVTGTGSSKHAAWIRLELKP